MVLNFFLHCCIHIYIITYKFIYIDKSNVLKPKQEEPIDYAQEQEDYVQEEEPTVEEITHHDDNLDIENEVIQQHDTLNDTLHSAETPSIPEDVITNDAGQTDVNTNDPNPINKFCTCSKSQCKCCRDFALPLVLVRGPGCATVRYIEEDKMAIQIKYGDFVLASRTVSGLHIIVICFQIFFFSLHLFL